MNVYQGIKAMRDNQKLFLYLGIIFLGVCLGYELPHGSYSISQYVIRPIPLGSDGTLYLSGIIPFTLFFIGLRGLFRLERFANTSKILIFFAFLIFILPLMNWSLDIARASYHRIVGDQLRALDIEDARISISGSNEEITIRSKIEVVDYSKGPKQYKIRLYLPESLRKHLGKDFIDFEKEYFTYGHHYRRNSRIIEEEVRIEAIEESARNKLFAMHWHNEDYQYEFYNENESVRITIRD